MSKQTESNLFIGSSISEYGRLYQLIIKGTATYEELGREVLSQIKTAHAFRQVEKVKQLSRILINFPVREYRLIGQYYLVWCKCRELDYRTDVLERIAEQSQTYKAKAIISRAALEIYKGNTEAALYFYTEALKMPLDASEYIEASRGIALAKTLEGFNKQALKDLEKLLPIIRHAEPLMYFDYFNSYAVELSEAGRRQEAENVSRLVIASPFVSYYPEWKDTFNDIRKHHRRRSSITVPAQKALPEANKPEALSNVIEFPKRDIKDIEADDLIAELGKLESVNLTPLQLLGVLLKVVLKDSITNEQIDRICTAYYQLIQEYYAQ